MTNDKQLGLAGTVAGLGLAIVSEVASVHAVQAQVDSTDAGTTIRVRFPSRSRAA